MPLLGTPIIVVGYYVGFNNGVGGTYGFREIGGTYTNLSVPVANSQTFAYGINNASQIVGYYRVGTVNHGFLYDGGARRSLRHLSLPQRSRLVLGADLNRSSPIAAAHARTPSCGLVLPD